MLKKSILKINTLSNSIIKIQNKIDLLKEELNKDLNYINFNKEIDCFSYCGDSLRIDELSEILINMKSYESESNSDISVKIEHTTENVDPYDDYETNVTNVKICADVLFSKNEIDDARNIKLAEIEELENRIVEFEKELKELIS